jgi:hypothetical protein
MTNLGQQEPRSLSESSTPEDCDRIVEELRYRNIKVPKQLDISWRRRIEGALGSVYGAGKATVNFVFSIPGMLSRAARMSPAEWRETLQGFWATVKHEAQHYWVRICA